MLCLKVLNYNSIFERFSSLFSPGDKYLFIEILNHYIQTTTLRVNFEKKQIRIIKNQVRHFEAFNTLDILKETGLLLKKIRKLPSYKIVLSLDPKLATTIYSSVPLIRQRPGEIIDEADIDNLVSQAIWRFFDRQRVKIARKMDIDDIDVLLSDVRMRGIKIDGHKVLNPIGFKAKSVEFSFSQTFIVRDFLRGLREILSLEKIVFVTEAGSVLANAAFNLLKPNHLFLIKIFPSQTILYSAAPGRLAHLDNYNWGQNNLIGALQDQLAVDEEVAKQIIDLHNENKASPIVLRRLENILVKELQIFVNGLESIIDKESAKVLLNPYFNLPTLIFSQRFQGRLNKSLRFSHLSTDLITDNFGFAVKFKKPAKVKNLLTILAAFLEIDSLPKDDKLNYLAKRRVRWLS